MDNYNSMEEERRKFFNELINSLVKDIDVTFPEYSLITRKTMTTMTHEDIYNYCQLIFRERKDYLLSKNVEIFSISSSVSTEFFPGVSFRFLWNFKDITDKTREMIWSYLTAIYYTIDTCESFDAENFEKILNDFKSFTDLPDIESTLFNGKLGGIAREMVSEMHESLTSELDTKDMKSPNDVINFLLKDPSKLMNMVKKIGNTLEKKMSDNELDREDLMNEATNLMKSMPDMGNMLGKLSKGGNAMDIEQMANELMSEFAQSPPANIMNDASKGTSNSAHKKKNKKSKK